MNDSSTVVPEVVIVDPAAPVVSSTRWWVAPMGYLVAGLLLVAGALTVYHLNFAPKQVRFAVLDLNFIMEAKELEFTAMLSSPGVTDVERKNALALVSNIEPDLRRVVADVRKECKCEILIKAAALTSSELPDITKIVAERMGVTEASLSASKSQLKAAIESRSPITKKTDQQQ